MENTSSFPLGGSRGLQRSKDAKDFFETHKVFYNSKLLIIGMYFQLPPWGIEGAAPFTFGGRVGDGGLTNPSHS